MRRPADEVWAVVGDPATIHHWFTGTIDVHDLGDRTSLVVYATDADPDTLALVIGGATGAALRELRDQVEADVPTDGTPETTDTGEEGAEG